MHYRHTTLKCCTHQLELGQPYFQGKSHSYKWWQGKSELSYSSCLMRKIENGDLNTSVFLFFDFSFKLWDGGERTWTPSCSVRFTFSCYNITCLWREAESRRFYSSMRRKDRMFSKLLFGVTCLPSERDFRRCGSLYYWRVRRTSMNRCKHQLELQLANSRIVGKKTFQLVPASWKPWSKIPLTRFFSPISNSSCWLKLELLKVPSCSAKFISSCYTITCLWSNVKGMQMILYICETDTRSGCFWDYCLDSHVSLGNDISVDADLCSTSSSHINLAGAFYGYPIRLVKPSDIDRILPLKLNCALFVHEYSMCQCATFKRESWEFNELLWCDNYQGIGCVPLFLILPPA